MTGRIVTAAVMYTVKAGGKENCTCPYEEGVLPDATPMLTVWGKGLGSTAARQP